MTNQQFLDNISYLDSLNAQNPTTAYDMPSSVQFALANSQQQPAQFQQGANLLANYQATLAQNQAQAVQETSPQPQDPGPTGDAPTNPNNPHKNLLSKFGSIMNVLGAPKRFSDHTARMAKAAGLPAWEQAIPAAAFAAVGGLLGGQAGAGAGEAFGEGLAGLATAIVHAPKGDLGDLWKQTQTGKTIGQMVSDEVGYDPGFTTHVPSQVPGVGNVPVHVNVLSGTIDAAVAMADDPLTYVGPALKTLKAAKEVTSLQVGDALVSDSPGYNRVAAWTAKVNSPDRIMQVYSKYGAPINDKLAVELADAGSVDEVKNAMYGALQRQELKAVPMFYKSDVFRALQKYDMWNGPKLFNPLPRQILDPNDADFMLQARRTLGVLVDKDQVEGEMNKFLRGSWTDRSNQLRSLGWQRLLQGGLSEDEVTRLAQNGNWTGLLGNNAFWGENEGQLFDMPGQNGPIGLPGYKELRVLDSLGKMGVVAKTANLDAKLAGLTGTMKAMWIMRPAFALRVSMDEGLASMAMYGVHPIQALDYVSNSWIKNLTEEGQWGLSRSLGSHLEDFKKFIEDLPGYNGIPIEDFRRMPQGPQLVRGAFEEVPGQRLGKDVRKAETGPARAVANAMNVPGSDIAQAPTLRVFQPNDPQHMRAWLQKLNYDIRVDPLGYKMLENYDNPLQAMKISNEYAKSPEGRAAMQASLGAPTDKARVTLLPVKQTLTPEQLDVLRNVPDDLKEALKAQFGGSFSMVGRGKNATASTLLDENSKEIAQIAREMGYDDFADAAGAYVKQKPYSVQQAAGRAPTPMGASGLSSPYDVAQQRLDEIFGNDVTGQKAIVPEQLRNELYQGNVTMRQLRNIPINQRPPVVGYDFKDVAQKGWWGQLNEGFHHATQMWLNSMVRDPVWGMRYNEELSRLTRLATETGTLGNEVSPEMLAQSASNTATTELMKVIHNPLERTRFDVMTRSIIPFNFAYVQFIKRWGRVFEANPAFAHRLSMLAGVGQHEGFFAQDTNGNLVWHFPIGNEFFQHTLGLGLQRKEDLPFYLGPAEGIEKTMVPPLLPFSSHSMPGFSPILTVPAAAITSQRWARGLSLDKMASDVFGPAFGTSNQPGMGWTDRILSEIAPTYMQRLSEAVTGDQGDNNFATTMVNAMQYYGSKGSMDPPPQNPGETSTAYQRRVQAFYNSKQGEIRGTARLLHLAKTVESLFSPYSPLPDTANMKLPSELRTLRAAKGFEAGTQAFLDKYGSKAEFYLQSQSKAAIRDASPSKEYQDWALKNE